MRKSRVIFFWLLLLSSFIYAFSNPPQASVERDTLEIISKGEQPFINYTHYGEFKNVGSENYEYIVTDRKGLQQAAGEGIYPDITFLNHSKYQDFYYRYARTEEFNPWDFDRPTTPARSFYAWLAAKKYDSGLRLFRIGEALRHAGHYQHALKAYYAVVVHFPRDVQWSGDGNFYWYIAPEAIARIRKICAAHPEIGIQLEDAFVDVTLGGTGKPIDDKIGVWPGSFQKKSLSRVARKDFKITRERGKGRVRLVEYNNRFWELLVDEKPFVVKGVTYSPTTVGESAHALNIRRWMLVDDNHNGQSDAMWDSWVDRNRNNQQDADEPAVGDAQLMKDIGVNTVRIYHTLDEFGNYNPKEFDKELMRRVHGEYGVHFAMGDFLGAYTVGSGAAWSLGTDYASDVQKERMKKIIKDYVMDHKDEPYVLMWILGNENQHPYTHTQAATQPREYAEFLNEIAKMIHELDPNHPVAVGNLGSSGSREIGLYAPEIDIYGANVYSGGYSMGAMWTIVKRNVDRPMLMTEFGADSYENNKGENEEAQAEYFLGNWQDIELQLAGNTGEGNAIGGIYFEWLDEWWKALSGDSWGDPSIHNTAGDYMSAYPDGWTQEEWCGIYGQGNGKHSPFLRQTRKISDVMKSVWRDY